MRRIPRRVLWIAAVPSESVKSNVLSLRGEHPSSEMSMKAPFMHSGSGSNIKMQELFRRLVKH